MAGTRKKAEPKSQSEPSSTSSQGMGRLVYSIDLEDLYIMAAIAGMSRKEMNGMSGDFMAQAMNRGTIAYLIRQEQKKCPSENYMQTVNRMRRQSAFFEESLSYVSRTDLPRPPLTPDQSKVYLQSLRERLSELEAEYAEPGTPESTDPPVG